MRTIKGKIIVSMVSLITVTSLLLAAFSSILSYKSAVESTKFSFNSMSDLFSQRIQWQFDAYTNIAIDTGYIAKLSSVIITEEDKLKIIKEKVDIYNFSEGGFAYRDGRSPDGTNYSDTDFFKAAMR